MRNDAYHATEASSFAILRALAMLGGMVAILLIPHPPEHQPYLGTLAWSFLAYKVALFVAIRTWKTLLRRILLASVGLDLVFVSLFVWFGGGLESHFYLLFYLLVALVAAQFSPAVGLITAGAAGGLYAAATMVDGAADWHHLIARVATFFLLAGSLGYLSQSVRLARAKAEALNRSLQEHQTRLEQAYRDLQAAQTRLLQSERLATIGKMSAKVAHEVRNPLSSVSLNTELLEDELSLLPEGRRAEAGQLLRAIRSQIDVLSGVTEGYLRLARVPKLQLDADSLESLVTELAGFVREELRARKVQLVVDVAPALPMLRIDSGQIRQALLNLIRNAAEAMPGGGTVRLTVRSVAGDIGTGDGSGNGASRQCVEIAVTDPGGGIPPEDAGRIFEPFFTRKEGGTGLGLAIAREIALGHGGALTCESASDKGSTFRLALPVPEREGGR